MYFRACQYILWGREMLVFLLHNNAVIVKVCYKYLQLFIIEVDGVLSSDENAFDIHSCC